MFPLPTLRCEPFTTSSLQAANGKEDQQCSGFSAASCGSKLLSGFPPPVVEKRKKGISRLAAYNQVPTGVVVDDSTTPPGKLPGDTCPSLAPPRRASGEGP